MCKFGIVVLNYQKYEMTEHCVSSLLKFHNNTRILIVDNGSSNESFQYLQKAFESESCVEVIRNSTNAGYASGNNVGFRYLFSKYPEMAYCCVMNPDVEISYGEIFDHFMDKLECDDSYAMVTGLMITNKALSVNGSYWSIPRGKEIAFGHSILHKNANKPLICDENGIARVEVITGSFFMMKRKVYEELGGFDEGTFLYNEENVLAIQLKKMGYVNIISVNDSFNHNHPKGERQTLPKKLASRKIGNASRKYLCKKYYPKRYMFLLDIVIVYNIVVITCMHLAGNLRLLFKRA